MLKKIGIYTAFALVGVLLGYVFFGNSNAKKNQNDAIVSEASGRWTCSMHPQIDGEENATCPLCAMDLVFMPSTDSAPSKNQFKLSEDALALANVQTIEVGSSNASGATIKLSGAITTNQEKDAIQTTLFDGRIDELYANYVGKKVRKGQEIGLIYSPELYLAQDKLLTSISYRQTHQKLYNAARNTLGLWKMTDKQIDAMLDSGTPMMNFPLYADVTGTVTEVLAKEGNYYSQGAPLFKTSDLRTVWAVFDAYETDFEFLEVGQNMSMNFVGLPGEQINGKIAFIEPILNNAKRTVSVRVVLNNSSGKFRPGMFVEGRATKMIDSNKVISIPKSAVLWTGKRSVVYKRPYADKPIFEMTEVLLGNSFENEYEILDGLKHGDIIVNEGTFTIDAAAQLNGKKSMMSNDALGEKEDGTDPMKMKLKDVPKKVKISASFEKKFDGILKHYMELKDALVATDAVKAAKASNSFLTALTTSPENNVPSSYAQKMTANLQDISKAKDVEKQRKVFKQLSDVMITLVPSVSDLSNMVYVQHCDCVDGFTGGSWLSFNENILNPYFGDKMLMCGRVEKALN